MKNKRKISRPRGKESLKKRDVEIRKLGNEYKIPTLKRKANVITSDVETSL